MRLNTCVGCGAEYDRDAYGTGWKWCSIKCRNTKAGTVSLDQYPSGRPSRFFKLTPEEQGKIIAELEESGWRVGPYTNAAYGEFKELVLITRGMNPAIRAGLGGGFHQKWAHIILFPDMHGKTMVESNCVQGMHDTPCVESPNWRRPGHKFFRGPCEKKRCIRCYTKREFLAVRAAVERLTFKRKLKGDEQKATSEQVAGSQGVGA